MVFSSTLFLFYFLPIILFIYKISSKKYKNLVLFLSSLFFYAWGEPVYVLLMLFSTISDFIHGKKIYENLNNKKSKIFLISSVIINLAILGFFKYSDFIISNINLILKINIPLLNLPLPIGISFYTFQTMSYSIDIYLKKAKPQKNILDFGLYVTLFPQLIAGPIVKYSQIEKELTNRNPKINEGIEIFIFGLAKKVVLANNIGLLWENLKINNNSYFGAYLGLICFMLQIYFDFSGYSDMAIGLGKMFGFNFNQNFNYPYISKSITEFWSRWHISLSNWFKEYVYIPLGGNKKGLKRQIINILIVWSLTGLWHGANFNYILWGIYFGIILIIEKIFLKKIINNIPNIMKHIYTLFILLVGFCIFGIEDSSQLLNYLKSLFINTQLIDSYSFFEFINNIILLIIAILCSTPIVKNMYDKIKKNYLIKNILIISLFIISVCYIVSNSYNPFLYFRF